MNQLSNCYNHIPEVVIRSELEVEYSIIRVDEEGEILCPSDPKHKVLDIKASQQHDCQQDDSHSNNRPSKVHEHGSNQKAKPL